MNAVNNQPPPTDFIIKEASSREEREEIYRLRYAIYVDEMKKDFAEADHARKLLFDELDESGEHLYARVDGRVAAGIRINFTGDSDLGEWNEALLLDRFESYRPKSCGVSMRLVIGKEWRNSLLAGQIMLASYSLLRDRGSLFNFCYCTASLVQLYECIGFRRYKENISLPNLGYRIPMVLLAEDVEHLERIRSPLMRIARKRKNDPAAAEWFRLTFAGAIQWPNARLMSSDDLWLFLSNRLHDETVPLLNGLTAEESKRFLTSGTIIHCRKDERPLKMGTTGDEMYVILKGTVDIRKPGAQAELSLLTLGKGEVFGEMSLLSRMERTADVVALEDVELLVLTLTFIKQMMKTMPEIAIKVLFNLSLILCDRLRTTTQNWATSLCVQEETKGAEA